MLEAQEGFYEPIVIWSLTRCPSLWTADQLFSWAKTIQIRRV